MGLKIESERVAHKMSQEQLSLKLGISRRTLYGWNAESKDIPSKKLLQMSQMFDCSVDYLLGLDENRKPTYKRVKVKNSIASDIEPTP